jgi:hypothetical protein
MTIQLKPMKLKFVYNGDETWSKIITDLEGNVIFQELNIKLFPSMMIKEYFDDWENQIKNSPNTNIVEVERFL